MNYNISHNDVIRFILFFLFIHEYCADVNSNISTLRDEKNIQNMYMKRSADLTESDIKLRPYMVQIISRTSDNVDNDWITMSCSGTIIAKQWILTSAQCRGDSLQVFAGSSSINYVLQTNYFDVEKRFRHPRHYKLWFESMGDTTHFDIMLLKLGSELTYSASIGELELAHNGDVGARKHGVLVGFEEDVSSATLKEFPLIISRKGRCKMIEETSWHKKDDRDSFCGGFEDQIVEGRFPCSNGFTGGPFVIDKRLVGVMTLGEDCSRTAPTFTNVIFFKEWIYATIKKNSDQHKK